MEIKNLEDLDAKDKRYQDRSFSYASDRFVFNPILNRFYFSPDQVQTLWNMFDCVTVLGS